MTKRVLTFEEIVQVRDILEKKNTNVLKTTGIFLKKCGQNTSKFFSSNTKKISRWLVELKNIKIKTNKITAKIDENTSKKEMLVIAKELEEVAKRIKKLARDTQFEEEKTNG